MIKLKNDFAPSSLEKWIDQLKKELKGDDFSKLLRNDELEELAYPTFHHAESNDIIPQAPGNFPFTRGIKKSGNQWNNGYLIRVKNEKEANLKALDVLMKGCDHLIFDLQSRDNINWSNLFDDIQFEHIKAQLIIENAAQFKSLLNHFNDQIPPTIYFSIDFFKQDESNELFNELAGHMKNVQIPFCHVDGYSLQQCGATTWQEIAFCIATGHEYLVRLLEKGMTIDQAAACIHFSVGIGSNYFYEIAKIRALKQIWASVIKEYNPVHTCTYNCSINAQIGFMNKSMIDPYTNLLRQTTEAMSAVSGGIDTITIHPYDRVSELGTSVLAERMALNISLILKEESYFDSVIDPLGGSYALEELTQKIGEKSWVFFQKLEELGGIHSNSAMTFLQNEISLKAELRKMQVHNNKKTLIGINKFNNSSPEKNSFISTGSYLGMPKLIFERELIAVK